jgi:hypothetical protein
MSLTLLNTPQKEIIICADINSFFVSDVSELDFRWTLPNQQSETKNITVTNVGTTSGTILSISLPSGFFTTQTFPQTVDVGDSIIIPIYFLAVSSADYSANSLINANSNSIIVSLLGGVQSYGLQFDGVNDFVISTQDVNWERTQAWTFFCRYENINWAINNANTLFIFRSASGNKNLILGSPTLLDDFIVIMTNTSGTNQLVNRFANRSTLPSAAGIIQITYSGNSLLSGVRFYIDNVERTTRGAGQVETLSASIVESGQKAVIGSVTTSGSTYLTPNARLQEISFVNYVKSAGELTTDFNNKFQSIGSGDYLFRQSFNLGGTPINLKADVLAGVEIDTTIIGQTSGNFVIF